MSAVLPHRCPPGCCWLDPLLHRDLHALELLGFPGLHGASHHVHQPVILDLLVPGKPGRTSGGAAAQMRRLLLLASSSPCWVVILLHHLLQRKDFTRNGQLHHKWIINIGHQDICSGESLDLQTLV